MITAVHTLIYSDDPTATRAFVKDVLQFGFITESGPMSPADPADNPENWLIFGTGPSELGVHPTNSDASAGWTAGRQHQITLMCDDLDATMTELSSRGAVFTGEKSDAGFGIIVMLQVPGADDIMLYQPKHPTAYDL